jgi:hypothetical protein
MMLRFVAVGNSLGPSAARRRAASWLVRPAGVRSCSRPIRRSRQ